MYLLDLLQKYKEHKSHSILIEGYHGVREVSTQIYRKYRKDHTFNGKLVLNAGCGGCTFSAPNVVNSDFADDDLSKPLKYPDNTFDLIIINHVLEHIPNWFDCFAELARVLKPGGFLEVWIPTTKTDAAFVYRDHINYLGLGSFCGIANLQRHTTNIEGTKHKDISSLELKVHHLEFIKEWYVTMAPRRVKMWMANHLRNIVSEEGFFFVKKPTNN